MFTADTRVSCCCYSGCMVTYIKECDVTARTIWSCHAACSLVQRRFLRVFRATSCSMCHITQAHCCVVYDLELWQPLISS